MIKVAVAETAPETGRAAAALPVDHEAVIVGAGFSGLGAAIQLKRMGVDDIVVVDRESDLGGTWHVNRYPGVAVDTASVTYSFSFLPNPGWSRLYAPGSELKAYADHVADTYHLWPHLRFGVTISAAEWDGDGARWTIRTADDQTITTRVLIVATGFLSQAKRPTIPGLDGYSGTLVHTADWPDDLDVVGRRVAVIGTGATSVQLVPALAAEVAQLDVYQRTPIWVTPKIDGPVPRPVKALFRHLPLTQSAARITNTTVLELLGAGVLYHQRIPWVLRGAELLARAHLRVQVHDPATRAALTPDYDFFCKRPTFSNDYLSSFNHDHVDLVTTPIDAVTPTGIRTSDGVDRPCDVLVLATGYSVQGEGNAPPFPIRGRGGEELGERWRSDRFSSYEGISVAGYPNLLYLPAPYAFSGLSFFVTIEGQMAHIGRLLGAVRRQGATTFEVRADAETRFVDRMHRAARRTVWAAGGCATANSYYMDEHGHTSLARLAPSVDGMVRHRRFPLEDYRFA